MSVCSFPTVELGWFDDGHVVTSETISAGRFHGHFAFVRRNVETGKIIDKSPTAKWRSSTALPRLRAS